MKSLVLLCLALTAQVSLASPAGPSPNLDDEEAEEQIDNTRYTFKTHPRNVTTKLGDTVKIDCDVQTEDGRVVSAEDATIMTVWLKSGSALFAGPTKLTRDKRMSLQGL